MGFTKVIGNITFPWSAYAFLFNRNLELAGYYVALFA